MARKKVPQEFINAFYHSRFKDNLFVIKAGGKVIEDDRARDNLMRNIRELTLNGIKVILIYGGGKAMDAEAQKRGVETVKKENRRVTDAATLEIMKDVVSGRMAVSVSESMAKASLPGYSFNCVPNDWMKIELRSKDPIDYGFVGDIKDVSKRAITRPLRVVSFVATSCLAITDDGQAVNINADTVATKIAIGAQAHKLIFMSDVDGVQIKGETALMITAEQIPGLIADGTATGGMQVKLENCLKALEAGVKRIHLINGLREDALKKEIYESVSPGTMIFKEAERQNYINEVEAQKAIAGAK